MNKNDKPHNNHYPYLLLSKDGKIGCYAELPTAQQIGRSSNQWYQIVHTERGVIDEA